MAREKSFICVRDGKWSVRTPKPGMRDQLRAKLIEQGFTIKKETLAPTEKTLWKWSDDGVAKTLMGTRIEPDGATADGCPSWLIALGLI